MVFTAYADGFQNLVVTLKVAVCVEGSLVMPILHLTSQEILAEVSDSMYKC